MVRFLSRLAGLVAYVVPYILVFFCIFFYIFFWSHFSNGLVNNHYISYIKTNIWGDHPGGYPEGGPGMYEEWEGPLSTSVGRHVIREGRGTCDRQAVNLEARKPNGRKEWAD